MKKRRYAPLLAATMVLGMLPQMTVSASARAADYLDRCEEYPSYCKIEINSDNTDLKSLPCTKKTDSSSKDMETADEGDTYTAYALYENTEDELWYEVETEDGDTAYVYAGEADFVSVKNDMKASNITAPKSLELGKSFTLKGVISTQYTRLCSLGVYVTDEDDDMVAGEDDLSVDTKSYSLQNSQLDTGLKFGQLKSGSYEYIIEARSKCCYARTPTRVGEKITEKVLYRGDFTVEGKSSDTDGDEDEDAADYLKRCDDYPTYCEVEVDADSTTLRSLPCDRATNTGSTLVERAEEGDTYVATTLYENTEGELWYEVETDDEETAYLFAGDTTLVEMKDDIRITGREVPKDLEEGEEFAIEGKITTSHSRLCGVSAQILQGKTEIMGKRVSVDARSYNLKNSKLASALEFEELESGDYTYKVVAEVESYYAKSGTRYAAVTLAKTLCDVDFTVGEGEVSGCSHSYTLVVTPPTCGQQGYTTYTCQVCGHSYQSNFTQGGEHDYVLESQGTDCVSGGYTTYLCRTCGERKTVYDGTPADPNGHRYELELLYVSGTYSLCSACGRWQGPDGQVVDELPKGVRPVLAGDQKNTLVFTAYAPNGRALETRMGAPGTWVLIPSIPEAAQFKFFALDVNYVPTREAVTVEN